MGRPRSKVEMTTLNLRLEQELKERLAAVAYDDLIRDGKIGDVSELNLSEWMRDDVLWPLVKQLEKKRGGRDVLGGRLAQARAEHHRRVLIELEHQLDN